MMPTAIQKLPSGVDLTLSELQDMAARQQQQIETQQQMLVAKEQRLKFLIQQELRQQQIASENEKRRKLRERVEAQELKLKKLRAMKGQANDAKANNNTLSAELEAIKALFNEKEKELATAVTKVEDLTKQLDELRKGRLNGLNSNSTTSPAWVELERLRKELAIRNKLNEQQNAKLAEHHKILQERKGEMARMDKRIEELRTRVQKKRNQEHSGVLKPNSNTVDLTKRLPGKSPIAAVEPYIQKPPPIENSHQISTDDKSKLQADDYPIQKQDPKYQTLPHSIKFQADEQKMAGNSAKIGGNATISNAKAQFFKPSPFTDGGNSKQISAAEKLAQTKPLYLPKSSPDGVAVPHDTVSSAHLQKHGKSSSIMSNFAPRPYGSTFASSLLSGKPSHAAMENAGGVQDTSVSSLYNNSVVQGEGPKTSTPVATGTKPSIAPKSDAFATGSPTITTMESTKYASSAMSPQPPPRSKYFPPLSETINSTVNATRDGGDVNTSPSPKGGVANNSYSSQPVYQTSGNKSETKRLMPDLPNRSNSSQSSFHNQSSNSAQHSSNSVQSSSKSSGYSSSNDARAAFFKSASSPYQEETTSFCASPTPEENTESSFNKSPSPYKQYSSGSNTITSPVYNSVSSPSRRNLSDNQNVSDRGRNLSDRNQSTERNQNLSPPVRQHSREASPSVRGDTSSVNDAKGATSSPNESKDKSSASVDSDKVDTSPNNVNSALNVLMSGPASAAATKPAVRYAPRSVIANTYMSKLGTNALDQYRKNMNQLYHDFMSDSKSDSVDGGQMSKSGSGSPTIRGGEQNKSTTELHRPSPPTYNQAVNRTESPVTTNRSPLPSSPQNANQSYSNAPPPYSIDPERLKFRPNAPRPLRRKISTGEMPDDKPTSGKTNFPPNAHAHAQQSPTKFISSDNDTFNNNLPNSNSKQFNHIPYADDNNPSSPSNNTSGYIPLPLRRRKGNLKSKSSVKNTRRVSFDPLALLLDASLEGELELVMRTAREVHDPSCPNDEGITALHNAICAGHYEIVKFLVEYGCNVNSPDSDGWTPLHCAASCNNLPMVRLLVERGACIFATTISDHETAAEKCEEEEDGYDGCSEYLYSIQEKLGILNKGLVYAVFDYQAQNADEVTFQNGDSMVILRKGDEDEKEWWWAKRTKQEGYIPRNLLGLYPRVFPEWLRDESNTSEKS